jgi:hypothetical protein
MPDLCTILSEVGKDVRALKENFISSDYDAPGIMWAVMNGKKVGSRQYGVWSEKRSVNFQILYSTIITYSGTSMSIDLDVNVDVALNRMEMISSDATAKDYEVREYSDRDGDPTRYNLLKSSTADQVVRWMREYDRMFLPAGSRLQFYFSGFMAGKTNKLIVVCEEI